MSWTRCCWLTTKVTTKARTSGRFWECYRGSTARQPVFLMCCHTTRTRFTKAATGIDCEGRWHSLDLTWQKKKMIFYYIAKFESHLLSMLKISLPIADWPLPVQEVTPQEYRPRCCWILLSIESTLIYFVRCETSLNISYVYRKCYMVPVICIMAVYGHDKHPRVSTAFFNPCKIVSTVYSLFIFISKIPYKLRLSLI